MSEPYSNREIESFMKDLKEQLDRIETQTLKTNGRTTRNEVDISTVNTRINTAIWAFGITVPVIIGLGGTIFFLKLQEIQTSIPRVVVDILSDYAFEITQ